MTENNIQLKNSPLSELHIKHNAKLVNFAGWSMPVNFSSGIMQEHLSTRKSSGLFDISHMGQIIIKGEDGSKLLESITPTLVSSINKFKVKYSLFLNENGGIIDDLMITNAGDCFFVVVNASRTKDDLTALQASLLPNMKASITHLTDHGMIALQGPKSANILSKIFPKISNLYFMDYNEITFEGEKVRVSRLGYTGEDGFEIAASKSLILTISKLILNDKDVTFCGLGARATLRLEAALPLYGNELNEKINPIQAGLKFSISSKRLKLKNFLGADNIINDIDMGSKYIRVGLIPQSKQPIRKGIQIFKDDTVIGEVTSGGFGPSIGGPISMAYILNKYSKTEHDIYAKIRDKKIVLKMVKLPFSQHNYHKQ